MFQRQSIPDIILIEPRRHADERGYFIETYKEASWRAGGIVETFVQDNESLSKMPGTIRGLHFQIVPMAQAKLVRCTAGAILDVAVDIRRGSATYGKHVAVELTASSGRQVYVPVGFAHAYCTLEPDTVVEYKVSSPYDPTSERGLAWNDPALGIAWPLAGRAPVMSPRDMNHPRLAELPAYF
ncbi:MAG TPA: dTDP-4-dehydrorhamnose 3,5-epimerase [Hyphomonadaceae bacterium]|nr:dTDP-4-dehydrorhamnose 3,5-epimerase [Hyphomonadaceae bacterium]